MTLSQKAFLGLPCVAQRGNGVKRPFGLTGYCKGIASRPVNSNVSRVIEPYSPSPKYQQ